MQQTLNISEPDLISSTAFYCSKEAQVQSEVRNCPLPSPHTYKERGQLTAGKQDVGLERWPRRHLMLFAQNLGWVPRTHTVVHNCLELQIQGIPDPLLTFTGTACTWCTHTLRHAHTKLINYFKSEMEILMGQKRMSWSNIYKCFFIANCT